MNDFAGLYDIRLAKEGDKAFIMATFLRGLYYGDSWFTLIPKNIFMDNYKRFAEIIVTSPKNRVAVACLKEDPDVILGYSILSEDQQVIHWCFVKSAWRKKGIATSLLPQAPTAFSHLSALGRSLMSKYPTAVFNPFKV